MIVAPLRRSITERLLAFTWVGHLPLALDGERITEIDSPGEDESGDVDLFALLGVACALTRSERRLARISDMEQRSLLLGDRVELGSVDSALLLPPPSILAGLSSHSGLLGFVMRAGTLFSLFDPGRLMGIAQRTSGHGGAKKPLPVASSDRD